MTVVLISSVKHFIGDSGDAKPTSGVPAGSTFYEDDTKDKYVYNGSAWAVDTLASILAKIIAAPATEAKQDTLIAKDFATQTTLAAVLAKIIAAPATEAKQDTLIAKDFATQTTLASILAKIIAAPATEAKQDDIITALATAGDLGVLLTAIKDTDGIKKITDTVNIAVTGSYPTGATIWASTADSGANSAQTITKAAVESKSHYITAIEVVTSAAAAGQDITVQLQEDAAGTPVTYWKEVIGNASPRGSRVGIVFALPIKLTANKTADLVILAGGASVVTTGNMAGYTL